MTKSLFFDTDCLSAFLWINNESLLCRLYPGRIVIPMPVYVELSNPCVPHLKKRVDILLNLSQVQTMSISIMSNEYQIYKRLTLHPDIGFIPIGKGEASSIALAIENNGIVASNNLKDISLYIHKYNLEHVTTGDILIEVLNQGIITEQQGNTMWVNMLKAKRKIGANSFTDYLNRNK